MIAWWSHSVGLHIASTRIRSALVMRQLHSQGVDTSWFRPDAVERYRTVVINKRYDAKTLKTVETLKQRGIRVVFDICDNRFADHSPDPEVVESVQRLRTLLGLADQVVSSTPELAAIIRRECPSAPPASVIRDLPDDLSVVPLSPLESVKALCLRAATWHQLRQARAGGRAGLVWFGNHASPFGDAGLADLLRIRGILEELNREFPVYLSVISNSRESFQASFSDWSLPTLYFDWHPRLFEPVLRAHDVALIPVTANEFTVCKTDNRLVTSFAAGLPVVADSIPSYVPYGTALRLGQWQDGLRGYLRDPQLRHQHVAEGRRLAAQLNDPQNIARQWREVLNA